MYKVMVMIRQSDLYPCRDVISGIVNCGDDVVGNIADPEDSIAVTWNCYGAFCRHAKYIVNNGGKHICMENGYLRRDAGYFIMSYDGFNGRGNVPFECNPDRFENLGIDIKPWNKNGDHILVCGQRGGTYSDMSMPRQWLNTVLHQIRSYTDRKIIYRPHPGRQIVPHSLPRNCEMADENIKIESYLKNAHAAVVWTSNSATDAIINGVPVFYCGPTIALNRISCNDISRIESPLYFDREPHLWELAYHQWNRDEISSGYAWQELVH